VKICQVTPLKQATSTNCWYQ